MILELNTEVRLLKDSQFNIHYIEERKCFYMCIMNNQPVNEYNSPCGSCPEYLNSCMPVIVNGFLIECDLCYCEWCSCYDDCTNGRC